MFKIYKDMKYKHMFSLKLMQIWGLLGLCFYLERFSLAWANQTVLGVNKKKKKRQNYLRIERHLSLL